MKLLALSRPIDVCTEGTVSNTEASAVMLYMYQEIAALLKYAQISFLRMRGGGEMMVHIKEPH
jgi:hypothetical protein